MCVCVYVCCGGGRGVRRMRMSGGGRMVNLDGQGRLKYTVPTGKPYTGAVTLPNDIQTD